jgi:hypothetical protein
MTLMSVWPAGFLQTPRRSNGWETAPFDTRATFDPETGPPLMRARVTAEAWSASATFPSIDVAERAAFLAFWDEIGRGARPFLWRDPDGAAIRKWTVAPGQSLRFAKLSANRWDMTLALIRLPSTPWWATLIPPNRLVAPKAAYDLQRGLYHNGTAQVGAAAAIGAGPSLIAAHGLSDVRLLTTGGAATVLLAQTLTAGWWPPSPPPLLASITVFASGALA